MKNNLTRPATLEMNPYFETVFADPTPEVPAA